MNEKLFELCKPVQEYLQENHNPYVEVVIYDEGVKIKQVTSYSPKESIKTEEPEKVEVKVEVEGLDEVVSKTNSLKPVLEEAKTILSELASSVNELEAKIYD